MIKVMDVMGKKYNNLNKKPRKKVDFLYVWIGIIVLGIAFFFIFLQMGVLSKLVYSATEDWPSSPETTTTTIVTDGVSATTLYIDSSNRAHLFGFSTNSDEVGCSSINFAVEAYEVVDGSWQVRCASLQYDSSLITRYALSTAYDRVNNVAWLVALQKKTGTNYATIYKRPDGETSWTYVNIMNTDINDFDSVRMVVEDGVLAMVYDSVGGAWVAVYNDIYNTFTQKTNTAISGYRTNNKGMSVGINSTKVFATYISSGALQFREYNILTDLWAGAVEIDPSAVTLNKHIDMAVDSAGEPAVFYPDMNSNEVRWVKRTGGTWGSPATIASSIDDGYHVRADYLENGNIVMSYENSTTDDLYILEYDGSSWSSLKTYSNLYTSDNQDVSKVELWTVGNYTYLGFSRATGGSQYFKYVTDDPGNISPTLTSLYPTQDLGFETVTVTTTIADTDGDVTSSTLEYSTNGTDWSPATISYVLEDEAGDGVVTGAGSIQDIDTDTDADNSVDLTIVWSAGTDLPDVSTTTVYLRMTPNDGTADGTTVSSSAFSLDTLAPTIPDPLTVNTTSTTSVIVNVPTATDDNFLSAAIYASLSSPVTTDDNNYPVTNFSTTTIVTTTLNSLIANTQYYANLWVYDRYGHITTSSAELSFYTLTPSPSGLATSDLATSSASFSVSSFTNDSVGSSGYYFDLTETVGGAAVSNSGWQSGDNTWSASSLDPNTGYTIAVVYRNGDGTQSSTSTLEFTTLSNEISSISTSVDSDTQITLSWTGDSTNYRSQNYTISSTTDWSTNTSSVWSSLTPNTSYEFLVQGRNESGTTTAWSSTSTAVTYSTVPQSVSATANSASQITVSWTNANSSWYQVELIDTSATSSWTQSSSTSFSGLSASTAYSFRVMARNSEGVTTTWSNTVSATTEEEVVEEDEEDTNEGGAPTVTPPPPDCSQTNTCPQDANGTVLINSGAVSTTDSNVTLTISSDLATHYYTPFEVPYGEACDTTEDLEQFSLAGGQTSVPFTFSDTSGNKTVCVKFYAPSATNVIFNRSANIIYLDKNQPPKHPCENNPPNIVKIQPYAKESIPLDGSGVLNVIKNSQKGNIFLSFQACKAATGYRLYASEKPFDENNIGVEIASFTAFWLEGFPRRVGLSSDILYSNVKKKIYDFPEFLYIRVGTQSTLSEVSLASVNPYDESIFFGETIKVGTKITTTANQCVENPSSYICVGDVDEDGIIDGQDNCPTTSNADQLDIDNDGIGNACDECPNDVDDMCDDLDKDKILDINDNCVNVPNFDQ